MLHDGAVAVSGPLREVFGDAARLAAAGLAPPEAAQVVQRLRDRGYPVREALTLDEAETALAALLERTR